MFPKKRNLEESSKARYIDNALRLITNFNKTTPDNDGSWDEFISWLERKKSNWAESTWRSYKASVAHYLKTQELFAIAETVEKLSNHGTIKESTKTTAKKKKSLTDFEESTIRKALTSIANSKNADSETGRDLLSYFECILAVGVRPIEIHTMEYLEHSPEEYDDDYNGPVLKVRNAKATNGRSFAEFRYIGLKGFNQKTLMMIQYAIATARKPKGKKGEVITYKEFYYELSRKYGRVIKSIWPKKQKLITLYTCRHQCIANMKNAGYPLVDIAVIVGHGNDITASEHYGKKRCGKARTLPQPNKKDLHKVSQKLEKKLDNLKDIRLSKSKRELS